ARPLPARAPGPSARRRRGPDPAAAVCGDGAHDMSGAHTLAAAQARDARDPLGAFRARFALPLDPRGEPLTYLCGHSLGLQPLAARERVDEELEQWAHLAVQAHEHGRRPWAPYHENL